MKNYHRGVIDLEKQLVEAQNVKSYFQF
jgi:hypothetical protein